jgi:Cof subfamily protein (haloacid dehalogenase superfamily)
MNSAQTRPPAKISALISDVDGTLVTNSKVLTERAREAVAGLRDRGIAFAITSARPPRGMEMLAGPLGLTTPIAGFNGGVIVGPDFSVIEEHLLSPDVARQAIDMIVAIGAQAWAFNAEQWMLRNANAPYVDHEIHTLGFGPTVVPDFGSRPADLAKIVGVSKNFDLLARSESDLRQSLGDSAFVTRSQHYYLDVTHPDANKGAVVRALSRILGIPKEEIAVIGDGPNDVAMFEESALSIAMGNAGPDVQGRADFVTDSNENDGFAKAIERYVLGDLAKVLPPAGRGSS